MGKADADQRREPCIEERDVRTARSTEAPRQRPHVAREPVAYAGWLKAVRGLVPVTVDATDDEQPLREREFAVIAERFPGLRRRYFRILARADRHGQARVPFPDRHRRSGSAAAAPPRSSAPPGSATAGRRS